MKKQAGYLGRHGFTLIELLVVIAIISLLVSILLPSLTKARELARRTVCAANLRSVGIAYQMYVQDHDGMGPFSGLFDNNWYQDIIACIMWGSPSNFGYLGIQLGFDPLLETPGVLICPDDYAGRKTPEQFKTSKPGEAVYYHTSYMMNPEVCSYWPEILQANPGLKNPVIFNLDPNKLVGLDTCDWLCPDWDSNHNAVGGNTLRVGGHVAWLTSEEVDIYPYLWQWNWFDSH